MTDTRIEMDLTDEQVELLKQHSQELNAAYSLIGKQVVHVMKNINNAIVIENGLQGQQEKICNELGLDGSDQLIWNLSTKKVIAVKAEK